MLPWKSEPDVQWCWVCWFTIKYLLLNNRTQWFIAEYFRIYHTVATILLTTHSASLCYSSQNNDAYISCRQSILLSFIQGPVSILAFPRMRPSAINLGSHEYSNDLQLCCSTHNKDIYTACCDAFLSLHCLKISAIYATVTHLLAYTKQESPHLFFSHQ